MESNNYACLCQLLLMFSWTSIISCRLLVNGPRQVQSIYLEVQETTKPVKSEKIHCFVCPESTECAQMLNAEVTDCTIPEESCDIIAKRNKQGEWVATRFVRQPEVSTTERSHQNNFTTTGTSQHQGANVTGSTSRRTTKVARKGVKALRQDVPTPHPTVHSLYLQDPDDFQVTDCVFDHMRNFTFCSCQDDYCNCDVFDDNETNIPHTGCPDEVFREGKEPAGNEASLQMDKEMFSLLIFFRVTVISSISKLLWI